MYNPSVTNNSNNTSGFIATTFDDFTKKKKARSENRKSYYGYLVRPDGSPLSEKDCLLLDLCIQWTKGGKICTSTYTWLLDNKFPRQKHTRTVSRTFYNISLYIKSNFKNSQIINGVVEKDKIKIERVADFEQKMIKAITKLEEQNDKNNSSKCQPPETEMSTMANKNVTPSTYIYKKTIKNTIDNNDYQNNQFLNSENFSRDECVETKESKIETSEIAKPAASQLAEEEVIYTEAEIANYEYAEEPDYADVPVEILEEGLEYEEVESPNTNNNSVEFVEKPENLKKTQSITSHYQSVEVKGKDGNTYKATPLKHYQFNDGIILEAISRSNKPHYKSEKVRGILSYILQKKTNMLVYGGRYGFINYLVKLINGEKDYEYEYKYPPTQEERAVSMAEIQAEKQKAIDAKYALLLQGKVQSLSGAGRYYG
jgi:hypothetical protein